MNVSGVGTAPPIAPTPAPAPASNHRELAPATTTRDGPAAKKPEQAPEHEAPKLPPMKGLSLTEVRVMLGAIPAGMATKLAQGAQPGSFDTYA